jgi:hypothetical protein
VSRRESENLNSLASPGPLNTHGSPRGRAENPSAASMFKVNQVDQLFMNALAVACAIEAIGYI